MEGDRGTTNALRLLPASLPDWVLSQRFEQDGDRYGMSNMERSFPIGPFVHRFAYAPPAEGSPAPITITYLAAQDEPTMALGELLSPPMGTYVIVCSNCGCEFGSTDAADAYSRFNGHDCRAR